MFVRFSLPESWDGGGSRASMKELLQKILPDELLCVDTSLSSEEEIQFACGQHPFGSDGPVIFVIVWAQQTPAREKNSSERAQRIAEAVKEVWSNATIKVKIFLCLAGHGKA